MGFFAVESEGAKLSDPGEVAPPGYLIFFVSATIVFVFAVGGFEGSSACDLSARHWLLEVVHVYESVFVSTVFSEGI